MTIGGEFVFDTGYGGSVYLTGETVRKYRLNTICKNKVNFEMNWGLHHPSRSLGFITRGKKLALEEFELQNPLLECSLDSTGVLGKGDYAGLLGNACLERFDVILDPVDKAIFLRPNNNYNKKMRFITTGIGFVDRTDICEGWQVNAMDAKSDASNAGVHSGDLITHVKGQPVTSNPDQLEKFIFEEANRTIPFTFKRQDSVFTLNLTTQEHF